MWCQECIICLDAVPDAWPACLISRPALHVGERRCTTILNVSCFGRGSFDTLQIKRAAPVIRAIALTRILSIPSPMIASEGKHDAIITQIQAGFTCWIMSCGDSKDDRNMTMEPFTLQASIIWISPNPSAHERADQERPEAQKKVCSKRQHGMTYLRDRYIEAYIWETRSNWLDAPNAPACERVNRNILGDTGKGVSEGTSWADTIVWQVHGNKEKGQVGV